MLAKGGMVLGPISSTLRGVRLLTLLGLGLAAGMLLLGAALLYDLRQEAWHQAEQASNNLALALEVDIERNLHVYDLSVQRTIEVLAQPGLRDVPPEIRQSALFDRATTSDYLASLAVLDRTGTIVYDSTSVAPHNLNVGDRDWFLVHRDNPSVGLFISKPFSSRLHGGEEVITLSRRIPSEDGQFKGVVVGAVRLTYFQDLFNKLNLGPHGAVTLSRIDGPIMLRQPALANFDRDLSRSKLVLRSLQSPSGQFVAASSLDGVRRLITYGRIGDLPLTVSVALSVHDIFSEWLHKAITIGCILICLSAATITLCLLFRREMRRRLEAESALRSLNGRLSVMAATDGLTGLANRRAFETELLQEWRRAVRTETPLGLLMLDADWFKAYNDRYGHQQGDEALRNIATAAQRLIRRPGDMAARYGGEEFVVLLPDTDLAGAVHTAERICNGVAAMNMKHEAGALGRMTVSVGVAVMRPQHGDDEGQLVRRADGALYQAKRSGRGRVGVDETSLDEAGLKINFETEPSPTAQPDRPARPPSRTAQPDRLTGPPS